MKIVISRRNIPIFTKKYLKNFRAALKIPFTFFYKSSDFLYKTWKKFLQDACRM